MFKKVFTMMVVTMVMMVVCATTVCAQPTYYWDTPQGRAERRQISMLEMKYDMTEGLYEEDNFSDEKVSVSYNEETGLYEITASWRMNDGADSVGMNILLYDDDYEIGDVKYGCIYINGQLAMVQKGEDDIQFTEYGQGYKEALGYEEEE